MMDAITFYGRKQRSVSHIREIPDDSEDSELSDTENVNEGEFDTLFYSQIMYIKRITTSFS